MFAGASTTFSTSGLTQSTGSIAIVGATDLASDATRDILYVADPQNGLWLVRQASSATPVPVGPIAMSQVASVSLDAASDRLVVGAGAGAYVFENAGTLTAGSTVPAASVVAAGGAALISSAAFN